MSSVATQAQVLVRHPDYAFYFAPNQGPEWEAVQDQCLQDLWERIDPKAYSDMRVGVPRNVWMRNGLKDHALASAARVVSISIDVNTGKVLTNDRERFQGFFAVFYMRKYLSFLQEAGKSDLMRKILADMEAELFNGIPLTSEDTLLIQHFFAHLS